MRRIRWTRTIVFDGPEDWVRDVINRAWLQSKGKHTLSNLANGKTVECTEYKVETYDTEAMEL